MLKLEYTGRPTSVKSSSGRGLGNRTSGLADVLSSKWYERSLAHTALLADDLRRSAVANYFSAPKKIDDSPGRRIHLTGKAIPPGRVDRTTVIDNSFSLFLFCERL